MRHACFIGLAALLLALPAGPGARAQDPGGPGAPAAGSPHIEWEVKHRFRLFRSEADFQRHVAATRNDGVLGAEHRLALESDGRGWAGDVVERLCLDRAGHLLDTCDRDGTRENYLVPSDHPIGLVVAGLLTPNLRCVWTFNDGSGEARTMEAPCDDEVRLRVPYGKTTAAAVDIALPDGTAQRVVADIAVRDVLIAGMGNSIAAGEGNPDRAVRLSDEGFCFRRFLGGSFSEYYRPGRDGYRGNRSCADESNSNSDANAWAQQSARWESGPCHRSLYSYQMRTALALAIESAHIAVTRWRARRAAPPHALPAVHQRALRDRLPGLRHLPHRRGAERAGLQPLRRDALLLQQLSRTRSAPSTGATRASRRRCRCSSTRTSPCVHGASWRSAPSAFSGSASRRTRPGTRGGPWPTARSFPPAPRPARPRPSSSGTPRIRTRG